MDQIYSTIFYTKKCFRRKDRKSGNYFKTVVEGFLCFFEKDGLQSVRLCCNVSNQVILEENASVERHPLKARNIYRCNVIPSNEACGPSLALSDNRRIFWQKSWLLLRSACCPSKPIFDWHLCPIETGITPSKWAQCQASRWVWAKACQKPSMCIKFKY